MVDELFERLLDCLSEYLPPPLYSLLVRVLSHSFAAVAAVLNLFLSLSQGNASWNLQTLLPPIITILVAYLALASLYRTTSWLIRLIFWFMKWGTLLGIVFAGVGYFLGNSRGNEGGILFISEYLGGLINNQQGRGRMPPWYRDSQQSSHTTKKHPKPWESFKRHQEWQHQQDRDIHGNVEHLTKMVAGAVGDLLQGSWWTAVKNVADYGSDDTVDKNGPGQGTSNSR